MTIKTHIRALLLVLISITLVACGGGSGGSVNTVQGQFVDSIVIGLRYETPTTSGFTDGQGRFNYRAGETVRFFVGDVFIGEAVGQAIITPVELVAGAVDESNTQVLNIVIFLQSVDDDGDESNGIRITTVASDAAVGQAVDFTLAAGVFDTDGATQILISTMTASNGTARSMVPRSQAMNAFRRNLLGLFAGEYQGTFAGDDTGSWGIAIDANGAITGISVSNTFGSEAISGSIPSSGQATINGVVGTSTFLGNFSRSGGVSGSWSDSGDGSTGTFTGSRVASATPPAPGSTNPLSGGNASGALLVSGADTGTIGTDFTPNGNAVVFSDPFFGTGNVSVNWNQIVVSESPSGIVSRSISFLFNGNTGSVTSIGYVRTFSADPNAGYIYSLDCEISPQLCISIILDSANRQVTFNDTTLAADSGNSATSAIVLNSALSW